MTSRRRSAPRPRPTRVLLALALSVAVAPVTGGPAQGEVARADAGPVLGAAVARKDAPAVIGVRRIGTSVRGRPIRAFHLGDPDARPTAVVLGAMHGDEKAGIRIVNALRRGAPVTGVNLWVIPTINPDGVARDSRQNARGVDLNRNFGHQWAALSGETYSGPRPWSEPESRALRRFLDDVRPRFMASFHQPLHGVGRSDESRAFQRRLARGLGLPIKAFNCSGTCHGTMTSWYNAHHAGTAITVELGASPGRRYLTHRAVRGTLHAVLGGR